MSQSDGIIFEARISINPLTPHIVVHEKPL
jgi:hypothetical protein